MFEHFRKTTDLSIQCLDLVCLMNQSYLYMRHFTVLNAFTEQIWHYKYRIHTNRLRILVLISFSVDFNPSSASISNKILSIVSIDSGGPSCRRNAITAVFWGNAIVKGFCERKSRPLLSQYIRWNLSQHQL